MKIGHLFIRASEVLYIKHNHDPSIEKDTYWLYFKNGDVEQIYPEDLELEILKDKMYQYDRKFLAKEDRR